MTVSRTRTLLAAIAAGGAIAAAALHAAPAHADATSFLSDIEAAGFNNPNGSSVMVETGFDVCRALEQGNPAQSVAETLYVQTHLSSLLDARQFVYIAETDLCTTGSVT